MENDVDKELEEMAAEEAEDPFSKFDIETTQRIHPALDFYDSNMFLTFWFPVREEIEKKDKETGKLYIVEQVVDRPFLLTSDKEFLPWKDVTKYTAMRNPLYIDNRFSKIGIKNFLNGKTCSLQEVFELVKAQLEWHCDLGKKKEWYTFLSLFTIGTYLFPLFNSYPYIYLNAAKRSGKTTLLTLLSCLCFNAQFNVDVTNSTTFRLIEGLRCTLLQDESEQLSEECPPAYRYLLLSGYKKGAKVPRSRELKNKEYTVDNYDVYCPKGMANIGGIDDILEDRCLILVLLRTDNPSLAKRHIEINNIKWQNIRDKLYLSALTNWKVVEKNYTTFADYFSVCCDGLEGQFPLNDNNMNDMKDNDIHIHTLHTSDSNNEKLALQTYTTYTKTPITPYLERLQSMDGRQFELWHPIFSLALSISEEIFKEMVDFAITTSSLKLEEDVMESADIILLETLLAINEHKTDNDLEGYVMVKAIRDAMATRYDAEQKWLTPEWVGKALKRLGFDKKIRTATGKKVFLSDIHLENLAIRFRIKKAEVAEGQKTLDSTDKPIETLPTKIFRLYNKLRKTMGLEILLYELQVAAEDEGISEVDFEAGLKKLISDGLLFSPRKDYVRSSQ